MHMFWTVAWIVALVGFGLFTFVIAFGAPFLPTLRKQVPKAFEMINLKPGQTLLELGSGDGRVLKAAAEQGLIAIGYELNPVLVVYTWLTTRKYHKNVRIIWGNYWRKPLPAADGIFVFLLQPYMAKLDQKIVKEAKKPVKLVSFAFHIPDKKPTTHDGGMFLYTYK